MFNVGDMVRYFTKPSLIEANQEAIRSKRNRALNPEALETLPDHLRFPVVFSMIHNDVEMRVGIMVGPHENALAMAFIDIPFDTYNSLGVVEVIDRG